MRRYIVAAKDIGAANVTLPVALGLAERGHKVFVALDPSGRGHEVYARANPGFTLIGPDANPAAAFNVLSPSAVIAGLSWPMGNEEVWGKAANVAGIPLVHIEDFWGASVRSKAVPDLVGAVDAYGVGLARRRFSRAGTFVSGNPGVREKPYEASPATQERVAAFRAKHGRALVLLLGIEWDVAAFFASCAEMMQEPFGLIVRIHPKVLGQPIPGGSETHAAYYERILAPWQDRMDMMGDLPTDDVVVCADAAITGYSTALATAAQAGVPAISLWTPETKRAVKESGGIDRLPFAGYGMPCVEEPQDLFPLIVPPPPRLVAELRPYRPSSVIERIVALAS